MKYKCTDCGQEYDIKPEFCDCGNNIFDEISDEKPVADVKPAEKFKDLKNIYPQAEFKPNYPKKRNVDIPSVLIFIICIVLSVCSWVFIGRDTKNLSQNSINDTIQTEVKEIPTIDQLWKENTSSVLTVTPQPVPEPVAVKVVEKKPEKIVSEKPKKATQTVSKPTQNTNQAKPQQQKTSQQPQPTMTEQEKQAIIQKLTTKNTPAKTTPTTVQPKQEPVKTEVKQEVKAETKPEVKPEVKAPDPAQLKKELDAYKIALRNKLGKSVNFAAVIGDGKCAVTFKLDGTGNLVNRKFSVQSKNNSLNDAVYAAMMQNATFKEPPAGYTGETLTLTVTMYSGNFEVTLK